MVQLHFLWQSEGRKFFVGKHINYAYARVISQTLHTVHLPLLNKTVDCSLTVITLNVILTPTF